MPRFFISPTDSKRVRIEGEDASHISRSLRMKEGDEIILTDGQGYDYHGNLTSLRQNFVEAEIYKKIKNISEPQVEISLYQALPKGSKLSVVVEKAVELGVSRIVPTLTTYCVSTPDEKSMARKVERYQRTAEEAAKQSGRGKIPEVTQQYSFEEAIAEGSKADIALIFYENETVLLSERLSPEALKSAKTVALFIGSEGGFSPEEIEAAKDRGIVTASLGPRILRTETAPIAVLGALLYALGEF